MSFPVFASWLARLGRNQKEHSGICLGLLIGMSQMLLTLI